MSPLAVSVIVFTSVIAGTMAGLALGRVVPEDHLTDQAKDVVKQSMALIGTMVALVLGLLVASAKSSWDTQGAELRQIGADTILLDRNLQLYGAETAPIRAELRQVLAQVTQTIWRDSSDRGQALDSLTIRTQVAGLMSSIGGLEPHSSLQKFCQTNSVQLLYGLGQTWFTLVQQQFRSIPPPFTVILTFWLSVLFLGFALFAPRRNPTVIAALFVCALSASTAMYLILELDHPFAGLLALSDQPLREAMRLTQP